MNNLNGNSLAYNKSIFLLNYKVFIMFLFIVPVYLFNNLALKGIGYIAIISIFIFAIFDIVARSNKIKVTEVWMWYFVILFYNIILMIRNVSVGSLYVFILQSLLLLFIVLLSSISLDENALKKMTKYGKYLYFIILVPALIVVTSGGGQAIRLFNGTFSFVIYKFMFPCTFFFFINNKHRFLKTMFFSIVFLLMTERTIAITIIIIYFIYFIINKVSKSRLAYISLLFCAFVGVVGFTYLYVQLQYTEFGYSINQFFRTYTGGNFFSGRNTIWEVAYRYISEAKYFGYGLNNSVLNLSGIDKSVHNTYLHILLQGGIVGLTTFYFFILSLWKRYYRYLDNHIIRLSASYLIGILIYINFEVTLIGNTVGPGIFMWLVIGIGLICSNNLKLKSDNEG